MIIGLTGGIGSGKSQIAKLLDLLGYKIFNSDEAAKHIYFFPHIQKKVKELLGDESYVNSKQINKAYISQKIFSDTDLLKSLNAIIHPAVISDFEKFVNDNPHSIIVKETALLFEAKLENQVDRIIVVSSPDELRIARVMKRDNIAREVVLAKIKSQLPQEEKIKRADFVIRNNETESLIEQVLLVHQQLKTHFNTTT